MIQRVNTKLGLAWYPKDWWNSRVFRENANNPTLLFCYVSILWYITLEGGEATVTRDIVCQLTNNKKLTRQTWAKLQELFNRGSVGDQSGITNQKWSHPSITKRLQKAKRTSETNKSKWIGRYQRGKDNTNPRLLTDDNPIKGGMGLIREAPLPPNLKNENDETELPAWAREDA